MALPIIVGIAALGLSGGVWAGQYFGTVYEVKQEKLRQKDIDGLSSEIKKIIDAMKGGQEIPYSDLSIVPNSITLAPTTERQAWLQSTWATVQAAAILGELGDTVSKESLLNQAYNFWQKSEDANEDVTGASTNEVQTAMQSGITALQPYSSVANVPLQRLRANSTPILIDGQTKFEAQHSAEEIINEGTEDLKDDVLLPIQILEGLFTGQRPDAMTKRQWNLTRFTIYGGIGLYGVAKVATIVNAFKGD
jgi:hypothetical protein